MLDYSSQEYLPLEAGDWGARSLAASSQNASFPSWAKENWNISSESLKNVRSPLPQSKSKWPSQVFTYNLQASLSPFSCAFLPETKTWALDRHGMDWHFSRFSPFFSVCLGSLAVLWNWLVLWKNKIQNLEPKLAPRFWIPNMYVSNPMDSLHQPAMFHVR